MIEIITISKWKEIDDLEVDFPSDFFRGQASADWDISSSLERAIANTDLNDNPLNTEFWLLREFKARARHYIDYLPSSDDTIGWLSLMQHHGAPTRLVDFTHSFYIACYFALISARSDAAVWAIDPFWLFDIGRESFGTESKGLRDQWEDNLYNETNHLLNKLLKTAASDDSIEIPSAIVYANPTQHNIRSSMQQGLFVLALDITKTFAQNYGKHLQNRSHSPLKKIILEREMHESGLAHLREMNITAESLFPGMDGFARSLMHKLYCIGT